MTDVFLFSVTLKLQEMAGWPRKPTQSGPKRKSPLTPNSMCLTFLLTFNPNCDLKQANKKKKTLAVLHNLDLNQTFLYSYYCKFNVAKSFSSSNSFFFAFRSTQNVSPQALQCKVFSLFSLTRLNGTLAKAAVALRC